MTDVIGGDIFTPEKIRDFHKKLMEGSGIPNWIHKIPCAICGNEIGILGVRSINFCLNASRIGDIEVCVSCFKCSKGYSFFFRNAWQTIDDFFVVLKSPIQPSIPEAQIGIVNQNNNLLEKMIDIHEKGLSSPN